MREGVNKPVGDGEKDDDGDGWTVVSRHGKRKIKQGGLAFTQENQIKALKMVIMSHFSFPSFVDKFDLIWGFFYRSMDQRIKRIHLKELNKFIGSNLLKPMI